MVGTEFFLFLKEDKNIRLKITYICSPGLKGKLRILMNENLQHYIHIVRDLQICFLLHRSRMNAIIFILGLRTS